MCIELFQEVIGCIPLKGIQISEVDILNRAPSIISINPPIIMSKRKRSDDTEGNQKFIAVLDYIAKKSSKYMAPPSKFEITPKSSNANTWFTFSSRKDYYPVGILIHGDDHHITDPNITVTMTVSLKHKSTTYPPYEISAKHTHGVYWFQAIQMHTVGMLTLTFTCNDSEVEPLVFEIPSVKRGKAEEEVDAVEESDNEEVEVIESDEESEIIRRPRKLASGRKSINNKPKSSVDRVTMLTEILYDDEKAALDRKSLSKEYFSSIKAPPQVEPVPPKSRLENTFLSESFLNSGLHTHTSNSNIFMVKGPLMSLKIPACLYNAFQYDRTVLSPLMVLAKADETLVLKKSAKGSSQIDMQASDQDFLKKIMSPCVADILTEVEKRSSHIANYKLSVEILRYLFEELLEASLLSSQERAFFQKKISGCESDKKLLASEFGPYFFLRFILSIIHNAAAQKGKWLIIFVNT